VHLVSEFALSNKDIERTAQGRLGMATKSRRSCLTCSTALLHRGVRMASYQVALFVLAFAACGLALAMWVFRRFALRLRGALVSAALAALVAGFGYWLGIGLAFMKLDVATGASPPLWAGWVVGALFGVGLAAATFCFASICLGLWGAISARRADQRGDSAAAVEQAHGAGRQKVD
jgi:hypothetical protein